MSILSEETRHAQQCAQCGNPIPIARLKHKSGSPTKYCSQKCGSLAHSGKGYSIQTVNCATCDNPFSYRAKSLTHRKYCGKKCRQQAVTQSYCRVVPYGSGLASGTVGAISELIVAADLLRQGFEVFRAVSPSCSCDLAILHKSKLIRVEVRTATITVNGKWVFTSSVEESHRYDVMALVADGGRLVQYRPSLSQIFGLADSTTQNLSDS